IKPTMGKEYGEFIRPIKSNIVNMEVAIINKINILDITFKPFITTPFSQKLTLLIFPLSLLTLSL
ncbi:hypothetical protein BU061_10830, partial [Staphylococcus succinus]